MTNQKVALGSRHYYLDWLRVIVFAYLVFFHTGKMFTESSFHIHSGYYFDNLSLLLDLTGLWRLDLLFFVSGVAISFMISKMSAGKFSRQRFIRLFIPLFFAIFIVVAPQSYYEARQKGFIDEGFISFWIDHYITFSWLEGMRSPFPTYNHMWYVAYLVVYSYLFLPLFLALNTKVGEKFIEIFGNILTRGYGIIWLPYVIYVSIPVLIGHDDVSNNVINDPYGHSIFAFILIFGFLFVRIPNIMHTIDKIYTLSVIIGLVSLAMYLHYQLTPVGTYPQGSTILLYPFIKWSWMLMLICIAKRYLNFTSIKLQSLNDIVYPFFILHQTIIIMIGYYIIDWGIDPVWEFTAILAGTYLLGYLLIEFVIKKTNLLRLLFGMKQKKAPEPVLSSGAL